LTWHDLDEWQKWTLGVGCSLIAAFIIWLANRLFGNRGKKQPTGQMIQQHASPVMTQTFQPTINIHPPPEASSVTMAERTPLSEKEGCKDDLGPKLFIDLECKEHPDSGKHSQEEELDSMIYVRVRVRNQGDR